MSCSILADQGAPAVSVAAPAKLNLYLHVCGKRDDGYHLLDSLISFAEIGDSIDIWKSDHLSLEITGPYGMTLGQDDLDTNLVLRAARALQDLCPEAKNRGARIVLTKELPVASGIGGGSADAAATLCGLCQFWQLTPDPMDLSKLALSLGADVPICLAGKSSFVGGIGEDITPAPMLPNSALVLINPNIPLSTPSVFKARQGDFSPAARFDTAIASSADLAALLSQRHNDLEVPAISLLSDVGDVLQELQDQQGCLLARMSGSGATCFGLFADPASAQAAASNIFARHPNWWCKNTSLSTF